METLRKTISQNLSLTDNPTTLLLFVIHDWLAHITDASSELLAFDSSLGEQIIPSFGDRNSLNYKRYMRMAHQHPTLTILLYRHFLVEEAMREEVFVDQIQKPIHILMGSMYFHQVRFWDLPDKKPWDELFDTPKRINAIRQLRPRILALTREVANRSDESLYPIDRGHATLSSITLLYTLALIETILTFEQTVRPSPQIVNSLQAVQSTTQHLRGVLFHG